MNLLDLRISHLDDFSKEPYRFFCERLSTVGIHLRNSFDTIPLSLTSRRLLSKSCSGTLLLLLSSIAKRFLTVEVIYTKPLSLTSRRLLSKSQRRRVSSCMNELLELRISHLVLSKVPYQFCERLSTVGGSFTRLI